VPLGLSPPLLFIHAFVDLGRTSSTEDVGLGGWVCPAIDLGLHIFQVTHIDTALLYHLQGNLGLGDLEGAALLNFA